MSVLRRLDIRNGEMGGGAGRDPQWEKEYTALHEYMTAVEWEDGKPRQVATLLMCVEGGRWRMMLNDRANARTAWVSGTTVEECLSSLSLGLDEDSLDWRRNGGQGNRGIRK